MRGGGFWGELSNSATPQLRNTPPGCCGVAELEGSPPKNRPLRSAPDKPDRSPPTPEPAHCRARLAKTMPPIQYRQDGTTTPVPPRRYRQASAISASRCITVCCRCELRLVGEIQVSRARECSGLVSTRGQTCFPQNPPPTHRQPLCLINHRIPTAKTFQLRNASPHSFQP